MTFLSPAFLAAFALIGVPVLIHFLTRLRRRTVPLPTIRFLRRAEKSTRRARTIRDLVLLALRAATVALLVAAFARPTTILPAGAARMPADIRRLVLLVDRSASMGYVESGRTEFQKERTRLDIAKEEALRLVRWADAGTPVTVIAYDDAPSVLTVDAGAADAEKAILSIAQTARGTNAVHALKAAAEIAPPRTVVLISDMAHASFRGLRSAGLAGLGPDLRLLDLSKAAQWNRWLAGIRPGRGGGAEADVRFSERAPAAAMTLDGIAAAADLIVTAERATSGPIPVRLPADGFAGTVRLAPDALAIDDVRHFVIRPPAPVRAGYVAEGISSMDGRAPRYLQSVASGIQWIPVTSANDLNGLDAVFAAGGRPSADVIQRLSSVVRGGGTLVIFGSGASNFENFLPAKLGRREEIEKGIRMGESAHSLLDGIPYETRRAPLSFVRLDVNPNPSAEVAIPFEDGRPYLVSQQMDKGRVYFFNTSADASWSDLPTHALFPVLLIRILGKSKQNQAEGIRVGDEIVFTAGPGRAGGTPEAVDPAGGILKGIVQEGIARFGPADRPGIYRFREQVLPVNVDPDEGDLDPASPAQILADLNGDRARVEKAGGDVGSILNAPPQDPQRLWRYLIATAIALAAVEIWLGRRTGSAAVKSA